MGKRINSTEDSAKRDWFAQTLAEAKISDSDYQYRLRRYSRDCTHDGTVWVTTSRFLSFVDDLMRFCGDNYVLKGWNLKQIKCDIEGTSVPDVDRPEKNVDLPERIRLPAALVVAVLEGWDNGIWWNVPSGKIYTLPQDNPPLIYKHYAAETKDERFQPSKSVGVPAVEITWFRELREAGLRVSLEKETPDNIYCECFKCGRTGKFDLVVSKKFVMGL